MQGVFDNRSENNVYNFSLAADKLELNQIELKKNDNTWPNHFSSNDSNLTLSIKQTKDELEGSLSIFAPAVKFAFVEKKKSDLSEVDLLIRDAFADLNHVKLTSSISGKISDPVFQVSSNIDDILAKRLHDLVGKKIQQVKTQIRNKIEGYVSSARNDATSVLNGEKQKVFAKLNTYQQRINKQKAEIENQINRIQ